MKTFDGRVDSVVAGTDISVDSSDPANPVVSYSGANVTDTNLYNSDGTISTSRLVTLDVGSGGSLQFTNPIGYNSDESNHVSGNNFPTVTYANSRLGGQLLDSTVISPSSNEDGYIVTWNNTNNEYELSDFGTVAVTSVFGRSGVVVSDAGDYAASQVTNDSTVTGAFVSDALETLATTLGGNPAGSTVTAPTSSQDGYYVSWNNTADEYELVTQLRNGFIDYNDTTGAVSISADTWTDIPNDGAGAFSNSTYAPPGVTDLMDTATGYVDPTELALGDSVLIRNDFTVNPNTNNALLEFRYELGTGGGLYTLDTIMGRLDSGSGQDYRFALKPDFVYMGDTNTRDNPIKLQIRCSSDATLTNAGSVIQLIRR